MADDSIRISDTSKTQTALAAPQPAHNENLFAEFASSMVYSAVEQPVLGVSQFLGDGAMSSVKGFFSDLGVHKAAPEKFMSAGWLSQTLGGAVGMVLPFTVLKSGLGRAGLFGDAAVADASLASQSSLLGMSLKESAITGFAYGAVFTPSNQDASLSQFLGDRLIGGVGSAATFSTLTASSLALSRLSESALVAQSGLSPLLRNSVASGVLSGVPAGLISGESDSLINQHRLATSSELAQSVVGMSMVGGVFGAKSEIQSKLASRFGTAGNAALSGVLGSKLIVPLNFTPEPLQSAANSGAGLDAPASTTGPARLGEANLSRANLSEALPSPSNLVAPQSIADTRLNARGTTDGSAPATIALLPEEQQLWGDIHQVSSLYDYRNASQRIEDGRLETNTYFSDLLAQQAKSWNDAQLQSIWPEVLKNDPFQAFRVAKEIGPQRMTDLFTSQLPAAASDADLAAGLSKAIVYVDSAKQLDALQALLDLPKPPASVDMASALLAAENEIPAAKMLAARNIKPQFETSKSSALHWGNMIFDLPVGETRDSMLQQLGKKIGGSPKPVAEELNQVYRVAQVKADPSEFESLRAMLRGVDPRQQTENSANIRATAIDSLDARFLGRLFFFDEDWPQSDKVAQANPDVIRALVTNTRLVGDLNRSAYLSSLLSAEPPITATQLVDSLTERVNQSVAENKIFPLSYGDLRALAGQGVEVAPQEVPALLSKLQQEAMSSLHLERGQSGGEISKARLLTALTLADSFGKVNPEAFQSDFKDPIENAMADSVLPYERRLEAARALGELQRGGYDAAQSIHMPELRMTRLVDLSKEQQAQLRQQVEAALTNRPELEAMLGDGVLGRLMPSVFGFSSEGGIVGRVQHQTHDSTVDVHVLDVVEKAAQDPEFARLLPKEQVNVLWASLLHDVGKRENMVDLDHGWTSTGITWGVLRTLGYPDSRIQRITDLMSRDADLSFDPDLRNSTRLSDSKFLDDVTTVYRQPEALSMVQLLNRSDIKSVKADGSWWTPEVSDELNTIRTMANERVAELNKHLLPIVTSQLPDGFSLSESNSYNVLAHSSPDLLQLLSQRSTVESPEYSMSVSLLTPTHQNLYSSIYSAADSTGSPIVALVDGPFEHISQAYRGNLSTGTSVGWNGHVELVRRWSNDKKAESLAQEAEARLAAVGIPPAKGVAAEQYPRLAQMRRVMAQFDSLDELVQAAGSDNEYVAGARQIAEMMTTNKDGTPLNGHNEIKLNNPILSGIGLLRKPGQSVYFEGVSDGDLRQMWNSAPPDYITAGPAGEAPTGSLVVPQEIVKAAKSEDLPIVILDRQ